MLRVASCEQEHTEKPITIKLYSTYLVSGRRATTEGFTRAMPAEWDGDRQKVRARARRNMVMWAAVSLCMVGTALYGSAIAHREAQDTGHHDCPKRWVGGSAVMDGSCWCGWDQYCMCTPSLAIDTVVEVEHPDTGKVESLLVIRRRDNHKLACIGGFVEVGETLEDTARREVMEETGLQVTSLRMIPRVYDDPARDARRHTVSVAYVVRATGLPRPGNEEEAVVSIPISSIRDRLDEFSFDHSKIITDYLDSELVRSETMTAGVGATLVPAASAAAAAAPLRRAASGAAIEAHLRRPSGR